MKIIRAGIIIMKTVFFLYILTSLYFGWQYKTQSTTEYLFRFMLKMMLYTGIVFYFIPLITLYKTKVEKQEKEKKPIIKYQRNG